MHMYRQPHWLTLYIIFLKNDFCYSVYIKFNICFVEFMLEEIQIDLDAREKALNTKTIFRAILTK